MKKDLVCNLVNMLFGIVLVSSVSAFLFPDFMSEEPKPLSKTYSEKSDRDPVILIPGFLYS